MLLHTSDWWPREGYAGAHQSRDRLAHLFPAAMLDDAAHAMIADQQWALCRQLYEHVLNSQLTVGHLTQDGLLGLMVANARLVCYLWPDDARRGLSAALGAVTDYAMGRRLTKRALGVIKAEAQALLNDMAARGESVAVRQSVEAVVAVLRAATQSRGSFDGVRHVLRALNCVEAASMYAVSDGPTMGRARGIAAARADIWQAVFLYLDLILRGSAVRMLA
jgi:hypothetical protein